LSGPGAEAFSDVVAGGTGRWRLGRVESFDPARGLGIVVSDAGARFCFHSTAISDGSRLVAPGAAVAFGVAAVVGGAFEAVALTAL
jgi:hypothetical protein